MQVKLKRVRLSFPHLWKPQDGIQGGKAKYGATFIIDKSDTANLTTLRNAMKQVGEEKWGVGKIPKTVQACLRDGATKEQDGYGDTVMFIAAKNEMKFPVVDKNPNIALSESDGRPYAGCYVHAVIRLWAQDNEFGKRINAQLQGVQFVEDGNPFGDKPVVATQVFDNESGEENPAAQFDNEEDNGSIPF